MTAPAHRPFAARVGLLLLVLLALALLSIVGYVLITEDRLSGLSEEPQRIEPIVDLSRRPEVSFPTTLRSYDPSVNVFVDRFIRVCQEGRYSELRLMYTRRLEPPTARAFVAMFNAVRGIRMRALERLPPLRALPGPVYRLVADCDLEEFAVKQGRRTRRVQVAIVQEEGEWRLAPFPRGSAEQLEALLSGTTQPAIEAED